MTELGERYDLNPSRPAFGQQWLAAYRAGEAAYAAASRRLPEAKGALVEAKQRMGRIEDDVVANGGVGGVPFDGKTEAIRKAQASVALEEMASYIEARKAVRAAERELASIDGDMNAGEHAMRGARLAMEWGKEIVALQAAVERNKTGQG